ncbi:MAG: TlpA family protein disulfide reductase [Actinomycetota bacterium]
MVPTDELEGYGHRSRPWRQVIGAVLTVALGVGIYLALRPAEEKTPPEFDLALLAGGTLRSDELKGSPVVLNFFALWCAPCREEAPLLESTWRKYRDEGVRFVGVDIEDTRGDARRFVREFAITFPIARDEDKEVVRDLGVYGLPQTFFIDEEWRLAHVSRGQQLGETASSIVPLGAISRARLEAQIDALLEGGDPR